MIRFALILIAFTVCPTLFSQSKMNGKIKIAHIENDFSINELNNKSWKKAKDVAIDKYWSGENAPDGRHFKAKLLWSDSALYVRFEANQNEPLVVSEIPNLTIENARTLGQRCLRDFSCAE